MHRATVALLAATALLSGCGGKSSAAGDAVASTTAEPDTITVSVEFQLNDADTRSNTCHGAGGYNDIDAGTQVTLRNGNGDTIGATSLGDAGVTGGSCTWQVWLYDVPAGEDFYAVEIGHRGEITKSGADLQKANNAFEVSLG